MASRVAGKCGVDTIRCGERPLVAERPKQRAQPVAAPGPLGIRARAPPPRVRRGRSRPSTLPRGRIESCAPRALAIP